MSTKKVRSKDDRAAALWADARRDRSWSSERQVELDRWLEGGRDRAALLRLHEELLDDAAVIWATQRAAVGRGATKRSSFVWNSRPMALAGVTAALACVVAAGVVLTPRGETIVGVHGAPQPVILADGSAVRLNGESRLRVDLSDHERRLRLKGEGFFEVSPDKDRPFSVEVGGVRVTAVGTRFNVDQRPDADGIAVEVVVFEGLVEVRSNRGMSTLVHAGERATVSGGVVQRAALMRPEAETDIPSWAKGWLEFNEASLASVLQDLERASGVKVELADPAAGRVLVSGRFAYDQPENALAAIVRLHGLTLTRKGSDRFVISKA
jgi:transmembrane sensor